MKKILICALAILCVLPLSARGKRQVAIVAHRGYWQCEAGGNSHNSIASLKAAQDGKFWGSELDGLVHVAAVRQLCQFVCSRDNVQFPVRLF